MLVLAIDPKFCAGGRPAMVVPSATVILENDFQMKILEPLQQAVDWDVWTGILNPRKSPTFSRASNRGATKSLTAMGIGI